MARVRSAVLRSEWTWLVVVSAGVALLYVALHASALDPGSYLDPWIYTALMVNFKYLFQTFNWSYYPSRLPWIIPGIVAHRLFGPATAFFVLHGVFFFGAGLFAYLTIRRFFGSTAALAVYALLMVSPLFYNAYATDYPDGALLTFLFGGVYFGVTIQGARRPLVRAGASGFFLAAAAGTNLFACIVVVFLLLLYAAVRVESRANLRDVARDAAAGSVGALALLVACGTFAKVNGGQFLFFMPSVRAAGLINAADYKAHGYAWLYKEPQLLLPLFAVACVGVVYPFSGRGWRRDAGYRFAVGAATALGGLYALLVLWEFAFTGDFLETSYYFSLFNLGLLLCAGSVLAALWTRLEARGVRGALFVVVVAVAAALPVLITYGVDLAPIGRGASVITVVLMSSLLVALLLLRRSGGRRSGVASIAALAAAFSFTLNYAGVGGVQTGQAFARGAYPANRRVLSVAIQLIDFMRARGLQSGAPAFWYNPREDENLNGIQSTYLWGITWVGLDMPRIDRSMKSLLDQRRPQNIVLLCKTHACRGGPAALAAAGYRPRQVAERLLSSGPERVWARAFALGKFAKPKTEQSPTQRYYVPGQAAFGQAPPSGTSQVWSFSAGAPGDWSGAAAGASRSAGGKPFATSGRQWDYEIVSPRVPLRPGNYALYLRGKVLSGGLDLGVLDVSANKWVEQRLYWYAQKGFDNRWMVTPFQLDQATTVEFILSNWVPHSASSRWQLKQLRLVRTG